MAAILSGCGSFIPFKASLFEPAHLFPEPTDKLADGGHSVETLLGQFIAAAQAAHDKAAKPEDFKAYASKGINLSNAQCNAWLDALSHQNTEVELGTGLFNITDNTLVAAMGLAEVSAAAVAGVGLGAAAVNAGAQQYRSSILFTPDFATLHQKIGAARKSAQLLMLGSTYSNVDDVTRDLVEFDRMCSRDSIQLLLQQSLAASQYKIPTLALPAQPVVANAPAANAPAANAPVVNPPVANPPAANAPAANPPAANAPTANPPAANAPAANAPAVNAPAANAPAGNAPVANPPAANAPAANAPAVNAPAANAPSEATPPALLLQNQPAAQVVSPAIN